MSAVRYARFKSRSFYRGSSPGHYGDIKPGSHVLIGVEFADGSERLDLGRVLGLALTDGDGKPFKRPKRDPMLAVLVAGENLRFGYVRLHPLSRVRELIEPGAFARWFLFGECPTPELAEAMSGHGGMSNSYLAEYLTAPEGALRADWQDVFMKRAAPAF